MDCITRLITKGVTLDCDNLSAAIGVDKDLILVNYADFDKEGTLAVGNREIDNLDKNLDGLTSIILKTGAEQYIFEGTDYSVIPTVTPEVKEDGDLWYDHQILFTVYSKTAKDRKTLESLNNSLVIAIAKDRSTGLFELFGADHGMRVSGITREYVGAQNSNFYQVTIATSALNIVKESTIGELAVTISTT